MIFIRFCVQKRKNALIEHLVYRGYINMNISPWRVKMRPNISLTPCFLTDISIIKKKEGK